MTKLQMIPWKNIQPLLIVLLDEVAVPELQIEKPTATGVEHSAAQPAASSLSSKDKQKAKDFGLADPDLYNQTASGREYSSDSDICRVKEVKNSINSIAGKQQTSPPIS